MFVIIGRACDINIFTNQKHSLKNILSKIGLKMEPLETLKSHPKNHRNHLS